MKIKNTLDNRKYKLLKHYMVITQIYSKKLSNDNLSLSLNKDLEKTEIYLKTILKLIYEFHNNNRKILFIGTFNEKTHYFIRALEKTKHSHINPNNWIPGIFKNSFMFLQQASSFKKFKKSQLNSIDSKKIRDSLNIVKRPALVVVLDSKIEQDILKEISRLNIPTVFLSTSLNVKSGFRKSSIRTDSNNASQVKYQNIHLCNLIISSVLKQKVKEGGATGSKK
jgi:hypothetical protein